jgi:hypothetical protein
MKRLVATLSSLALLLIVLLETRPHAVAANVSGDEQCRNRVLNELTLLRDEERAVIFGSRKDADGKFKVLTGGNDTKERKGILETKERLTSELVEPIVESYKTYRCKAVAVCSVVGTSLRVKGGDADIDVLGCKPQTLPRYNECFISPDVSNPDDESGTKEDIAQMQAECDSFVEDSLAAERAVLRLAVAYDTGYRSTLQFAGMMDWMMEDLPTRAVRPLRDMVNMLGKLHEIPCFIGQCDNPDTTGLAP